MKWLLLQISDEELKRLGLDEPNRDANDWLDRVIRAMDSKLDKFLLAHSRLAHGSKSRAKSGMLKWLDRFQENMQMHIRRDGK